MRDANLEQISQLNCEKMEIDLCQCVNLLVKHKKTFIGVFLFVLGIGFWCFLSSPEIYRTSVFLQSSSFGELLAEGNDFKSANNLKGLIMNNSFNEALRKRLNLDPNTNNLEFNVVIPDKSDILQVSIDLESKEKEFGVVILQDLVELISESYAKRIEIESDNIVRHVKLKERAIVSAKEKVKRLKEQIRGVTVREDKLSEEKEFTAANTAQILDKRKGLLKANAAIENADTLFLANQIQNNSSYLNRVNNKLGELSLRKEQLGLELKNINSQINNFQKKIDSLNISKDYIPSLKIISQPKISPTPISSKKIKTLCLFLVMGVFSGWLAVLLQEFWVSKLKKHD